MAVLDYLTVYNREDLHDQGGLVQTVLSMWCSYNQVIRAHADVGVRCEKARPKSLCPLVLSDKTYCMWKDWGGILNSRASPHCVFSI